MKNKESGIPDDELDIILNYPKLLEAKTGDVALFTRDDFSGLFITWGTFTTLQHSAIFVWLDRQEYENGKIKIVPTYNTDNDLNILCFMTITKRRLNDMYTKTYKNGLVLTTLSDFVEIGLTAVYNRMLSSLIEDDERQRAASNFIEKYHKIMKYESDIRSILGVGLNIPYSPYENRLICTTMVHRFLSEELNYPNRDSDCPFVYPTRDPAVLRAKDFTLENNQSPVLGGEEELIYGTGETDFFGIFHPFTVTLILGIFLLVIILLSLISCANISMFKKNKYF